MVAKGISVLTDLGGGTLDIADTDIALTGPQGYDPQEFARLVREYGDTLAAVYSLSASLPPLPRPDEGPERLEPPRFTAVRTEDGAVRIRGDVNDPQIRDTAGTFAEAKFGFNTVINETELRGDLPSSWAVRVVSGLEALGGLTTGQLEVTDGNVTLTGATATLENRENIETLLRSRLPEDVDVLIEVWEAEALEVERELAIPASLCAEQIDLILSSASINFPPGETDIDAISLPIVDRIAEVLADCPGARFEVQGHTDSQGRESSNMAISQARADAVLAALLERNVDTIFLTARGYGETTPIADNDTELGRARNRRIAFSLIEDIAEPDTIETASEGVPDTASSTPSVMAAVGDAAASDGDGAASDIDTARRESPTTIVVPAGTAPENLLPPAALDSSGDDVATDPTDDDASEAGETEAAALTTGENEAASDTATSDQGAGAESAAGVEASPASDAATAATGEIADNDASEENFAGVEQEAGSAGGPLRPRPRPENLDGAGN